MKYLRDGKLIDGEHISVLTPSNEDKIVQIDIITQKPARYNHFDNASKDKLWRIVHYDENNKRTNPKDGDVDSREGYLAVEANERWFGLNGYHATIGEILIRALNSGHQILFDGTDVTSKLRASL